MQDFLTFIFSIFDPNIILHGLHSRLKLINSSVWSDMSCGTFMEIIKCLYALRNWLNIELVCQQSISAKKEKSESQEKSNAK